MGARVSDFFYKGSKSNFFEGGGMGWGWRGRGGEGGLEKVNMGVGASGEVRGVG